MWIRSQDRTALLDCDNFEVESYSNAPPAVVTLNNRTNIDVDLGVYSSKEKALKVLDEIQNWIHYEADENGITYQMPQDVDVRV